MEYDRIVRTSDPVGVVPGIRLGILLGRPFDIAFDTVPGVPLGTVPGVPLGTVPGVPLGTAPGIAFGVPLHIAFTPRCPARAGCC
ncbi:hypothetical protein [Kitasatospora sp. NPDC086791]|uniref:hypothetical protein n=1 Tax=Kitasatospora sp. NPDC086791 TaxID=3155178 RepID=UPI00343BEBC4